MKRYIFVYIAAALLVFCPSCTKTMVEDGRIHLYASMGYVPVKGTASDDSGVKDYDYDEELTMGLVRVDENEAGSAYPEFKKCGAPLVATLGRPDAEYKRDVEFTSAAQYFRNDADHIRYASWYPLTDTYNFSDESSKLIFNVDGVTDILYGTVVDGNRHEGFDEIVLNHGLCQFNIYIYKMTFNEDGSPSEGDVDWGAVNELIVKNVQKKCVMTLPRSESDDKYEFEYPADDLFNLDLKLADGVYWNPGSDIPAGFDGKKLISTYIAPPPVGGYITYEVNTTTQSAHQKVSIARNFQKGCAYDIVLRFTSHGLVNAEVSVGKWNYKSLKGGEKITQDVAADMYFDLSAYMKANSYIVPAGNYGYSFVGNVKGDSEEALTTDGTDPGYIDVLWSDNPDIWDSSKNPDLTYAEGGNYFQLSSHTLSKNRVMFKVGNIKENDDKRLLHKGNVVLAAYRDETKTEILWTWHIWLNDRVSPVGYTNGYLALNQNLGALSPDSPGLYYQWGRKDPFVPGLFTTSSSRVSIAETVKNPTVFYGQGSDSWYEGTLLELSAEGSWSSDASMTRKSIYDPCPPGYFVPDSRMWSTETIARYEKQYNAGSYVSLEIQNSEVRFPLNQGYLDANALKTTADVPLFLWSSSLNKGVTAPYLFTYPSTGVSPVSEEPHINYGGAVRCIAKAPEAAKNLSAVQTANCYIISDDGLYKFKASVAGNGVSVLISDKGDEWDMTGKSWGDGVHVEAEFQPDRVDYLWFQPALDSEIPSAITSDDICVKILDDGKLDSKNFVTLEVTDWKPGNLILAAYKGEKILWSWHIWLTDEPSDDKGTWYSMMDRNLGATSAIPVGDSPEAALATYGLYYQWGRKDPIVGASSAKPTTGSAASMRWFEYDGTAWTPRTDVKTIAGPIDVKVAAENPEKMVTCSTTYWMYGYTDAEPAKSKVAAMWGYAVNGGGWGNKPTKSLYDPCPPGYMGPHHWVFWNTPGQGTNGNSSSSNFQTYGSYGFTWDQYSSGNYYPLSGIRSRVDGSEANVGTTGEYWSSVPQGADGRYVAIGGIWRGLFKNTPDNRGESANAMSVRCLKQ